MQRAPLIVLGSTGSVGTQALDVAERTGTPVEAICAHRGRDFLALGMYSRQGGLECGWPARFYGQVYVGDQTLEQYIRSIIGG